LQNSSQIRTDKGAISFNGTSYQSADTYRFRDAGLNGFEGFKFFPFGTIAHRVQLGMDVGGGLLWYSGSIDKQVVRYSTQFDQATSRVNVVKTDSQTSTTFAQAVADLGGPSFMPEARVEAVGNILIGSGLKLRIAGGYALPGNEKVTISAVYFFGKY